MQQREFPGSACELLQGSRAGLARPRSRIASHRTKESLTKGPRRGVARVQAEKVLLEDLNSGKINKEYLRELKNKETAPKQVVKGQLKQKGRMEEKDEKDKDEANSGGSDL